MKSLKSTDCSIFEGKLNGFVSFIENPKYIGYNIASKQIIVNEISFFHFICKYKYFKQFYQL